MTFRYYLVFECQKVFVILSHARRPLPDIPSCSGRETSVSWQSPGTAHSTLNVESGRNKPPMQSSTM
jgi:hypothetical protein